MDKNIFKEYICNGMALISVPGKVVGESLTALENDGFAVLLALHFILFLFCNFNI